MLSSDLKMVQAGPATAEQPAELRTTLAGTTVLLRPGKEKEDVQTVEVWDTVGLQAAFNLQEVDKHGRVYADSEFGSLELAPDCSSLAYIAERKKEKNAAFLAQSEPGEGVGRGGEAEYREDWGEQLVGKVSPVVVVLGLGSQQPVDCRVVAGVPTEYCPGLVRWWQGGLVGVAYKATPRKLGKIYCSNREAVVFTLSLDGEWTVLAGEAGGLGVTRLWVTPGGCLVWTERDLTVDGLYPGPHGAALRLMTVAGGGGAARELVAAQQPDWTGLDPAQFTGIFHPVAAPRPWLAAETLVLTCALGETTRPLLVDVVGGGVVVPSSPSCAGVQVLDCSHDLVLGVRSDPVTPPHLVAARVDPASPGSLEFVAVTEVPACPVPGLTWTSLTLHPTGPPALPFTAHYFGPAAGNTPLILWPHGGPHSVLTTDYKNTAMFFASLGLGLLFVNYRGSTGFGEAGVRSLLGRVGSQDVGDCEQARQAVLTKLPHLQADKVCLMGGSHGGFLVLHLAGQFPAHYRGVVARNPVTNLARCVEALCLQSTDICTVHKTGNSPLVGREYLTYLLFPTSSKASIADIPESAWVTSLGQSYPGLEPGVEQLAAWLAVSPLSVVAGVQCPVLLCCSK